MQLNQRISAFQKLGKQLRAIDEARLETLAEKVVNENPWFTKDSLKTAFTGLQHYLDPSRLEQWTSSYSLKPASPKTVAVVMAGNIPLAGFHDFLSVLISGHKILVKLSSKDSILLPFLADELVALEPEFRDSITFTDRLKDFDAVIATGSDNSARYFEYYFGKYPHIIRRNRTSCAVLSGNEKEEELAALGTDVFTYFGLGCRNVSKIFVPPDYSLPALIRTWEGFAGVMHHHKYHNNYDYQKSILLVNRIPFMDSGFVLLEESEKLVSPISVVYYQTYSGEADLREKLRSDARKIQCVVGSQSFMVPFGKAQFPEVWDYADQVNTLEFLDQLQGA